MGPVKSPDTVGKLVREALANTRLNLPRELKKKGIDAPNWGKSGPYNNSLFCIGIHSNRNLIQSLKELQKTPVLPTRMLVNLKHFILILQKQLETSILIIKSNRDSCFQA